MDKDNIIQFNNLASKYDIKYKDMVENDGYLQLTAINCLSALEYNIDEESIKEFQSDMGLEVTGVIGLADLTCAVEAALDVNMAQKVYNYLSEYKLLQSKLSVSKEKEKRRNNRLLIIGCIIAFIFFMIGAFTFYSWLKELIINLVRTYM